MIKRQSKRILLTCARARLIKYSSFNAPGKWSDRITAPSVWLRLMTSPGRAISLPGKRIHFKLQNDTLNGVMVLCSEVCLIGRWKQCHLPQPWKRQVAQKTAQQEMILKATFQTFPQLRNESDKGSYPLSYTTATVANIVNRNKSLQLKIATCKNSACVILKHDPADGADGVCADMVYMNHHRR